MRRTKRILDGTVHLRGFSRFKRSTLLRGGEGVRFVYPSGTAYDVPTGYLVRWFDMPAGHKTRIRATRVIAGGMITRVYLTGGGSVDVAWDTVLMACEPAYEHFGGLTARSQRTTHAAARRYGSLRKDQRLTIRPSERGLRPVADLRRWAEKT